MKIDDLDTELLLFLVENPDKTSWDIAQALSRVKEPRRVSATETLVRYHLKKLVKYGVVERLPTKRNIYRPAYGKVFLGEGNLVIPVRQLPEPLSMNMGEFLVVTNGANHLIVKSIDEVVHRLAHEK